MKPLLLIDIDGVLLPFGGKLPKDVELIELPWGQLLPGSPSMRGRLAALRDDFELHWGSMWQEAANETIGPWHSLPQLPYVTFLNWDEPEEIDVLGAEVGSFIRAATTRTYKLPAIRDYVGDRPFAWIDDHIFADGFAWQEERNEMDLPTLFVRTDPAVGMTDEDVQHLLDFAEAVRGF